MNNTHSSHPLRHFRLPPRLLLAAIIIIVLLTLIICLVQTCKHTNNHIEIAQNEKIDITPTQVRSLEDIGEWEFLSIADEELVDTMRRGFFSDSRLVRIYYGTVRLGINMHEVAPDWITMDQDTVKAVLPPIKILDNDFIDEARTKSFYEEGDWSNDDRERMYHKARRVMLTRCLTPSNIRSAEQNACLQMTALLHSMGFEFVKVRLSGQKEHQI